MTAGRTAESYYYPCDIESAVVIVHERLMEWSYAEDAHGWCHDRPSQLALLDELVRLRPDLREHIRTESAYDGWPTSATS